MAAPQGKLPGWLPAVNRAVRGMSRVGLTLGPIEVLTVPGRSTGKPRATPVSPLTVAGKRYVIAAIPDGDWARNVRAAKHCELARGRRRQSVSLAEVTDADERREVMRAFPREVPGGVSFFVRLGLVTKADPDEFAAAADHVAVFRLASA